MVIIWTLIAILFPNSGPGIILTSVLIALLILSPWMYALSKIIWANFFFTYKKGINDKKVVNSHYDQGT